jgi:hypothetical protein
MRVTGRSAAIGLGGGCNWKTCGMSATGRVTYPMTTQTISTAAAPHLDRLAAEYVRAVAHESAV